MNEKEQSCLTCTNRKEWFHDMYGAQAECLTRPAFWGMTPVWVKPQHGKDCKLFRARAQEE